LVLDGTGAPAKPDQTIIIIKGKIAAIGNANKVTAPLTAKIIDCRQDGHSRMVMMHEHLFYGISVASLLRVGNAGFVSCALSRWWRHYHAYHRKRRTATDLNIRNEIRQVLWSVLK
jgi:hypothetical protein